MKSNPIKLFSLFASLLLAACGTAASAEGTAESLASSSRSDRRSVATTDVATTDVTTTELAISETFLLTELTDLTKLADETTTLQVLEQTVDSVGPSTGSSKISLEDLSTEGLSTERLSTEDLSTETLTDNVYVSMPAEGAAEAVLPSTEETLFLAGDSVTSSQSRTSADLSSNARFSNSLFLLADGGTPHFGDAILWSPSRPDSHAPIGVMGDHTHGKGEFMLSYRYMYMDMDGNRNGTDSLSTADVLQDFMVTPVRMSMEMHMLGAMYAPTDDLTLMTMLPYITKEMDHLTRMGGEFTTNSEGIGDVQLGGLYTVLDRDRQRVHLNLGLSLPTGSIEERDATPMGPNQILPYPMQIGSGTFDLHPGVTYLGQAGRWSWGSQAKGVIRLGENGNGYRQGNQFMLTGWGARSWTNWFSTSLRLDGRTWGNYGGQDDRLNPAVIPTADPDLRAGTQLDVGLGLNFYVPEGDLQGLRFAVEFNLPIYRRLSGPQLETDFSATAGLQAAF